MERISSKVVHEGPLASVRMDEFRYPDGTTAVRQVVTHPGAVAVVAFDERFVYLVRQPREAVGEEALLEVPAGKLDVEGESPLDCAKRELAEEIGKGAGNWQHIATCYSSPGFSNEQMHIYLATDLYDEAAEAAENERIEIETFALDRLDEAIDRCADAKSLIGLLWLKAHPQELGA